MEVDHSTLNRWVIKCVPPLEKEFRARKCPVGRSWRMDETYVKVRGVWKYLYRAVDKSGATVDFLLTAKRDHRAALRFLRKRSVNTVFLRRSPSTKAAPTRRRLKATIGGAGEAAKRRAFSDEALAQYYALHRRTPTDTHAAPLPAGPAPQPHASRAGGRRTHPARGDLPDRGFGRPPDSRG